ncbi:lipoyl synthase [candidate division KSB1 bacterium 4484_188]|nr:MAG: lipoyl synthase [candidate division KSB1 bacterium 4484_188]HFE63681.1 lipoyl synthase [Caldithrix sp.]
MAIQRRPEWLKVRLAGGKVFREVRELVETESLHTVCQSARCPNIGDCWSRRTATFMILGDVCTRNCRFCAVKTGVPGAVAPGEAERVARAVKKLRLRHAVITSVNRDDLPDGGAGVFAEVIRQIRRYSPSCSVEVLIPDFEGNTAALDRVFREKPDILNHNLEVVPRLYAKARPQADFERSLAVLELAKKNNLVTKTGIMVGLGETRAELTRLLERLVEIRVDILTIGQYLQPTARHLTVERFYSPEEFLALKQEGEALGLKHVESGPLVRSSYHADEQVQKIESLAQIS